LKIERKSELSCRRESGKKKNEIEFEEREFLFKGCTLEGDFDC